LKKTDAKNREKTEKIDKKNPRNYSEVKQMLKIQKSDTIYKYLNFAKVKQMLPQTGRVATQSWAWSPSKNPTSSHRSIVPTTTSGRTAGFHSIWGMSIRSQESR
jgi:hypothetical protein